MNIFKKKNSHSTYINGVDLVNSKLELGKTFLRFAYCMIPEIFSTMYIYSGSRFIRVKVLGTNRNFLKVHTYINNPNINSWMGVHNYTFSRGNKIEEKLLLFFFLFYFSRVCSPPTLLYRRTHILYAIFYFF